MPAYFAYANARVTGLGMESVSEVRVPFSLPAVEIPYRNSQLDSLDLGERRVSTALTVSPSLTVT